MVWLPVPALLEAVTCMVDVPDPDAVIVARLRLTVSPLTLGADNATAALNPPEIVVVIVVLPDPPRFIDKLVGEAAIMNAGVGVIPVVSAAINPAFGLPHPVTRS